MVVKWVADFILEPEDLALSTSLILEHQIG